MDLCAVGRRRALLRLLCPAALLGMFCLAASAQTVAQCTATAVPAVVASAGLTEKLPDIQIICTGGTSGATAIGAFYISLNTAITNTLDSNGLPKNITFTTSGATVTAGTPTLSSSTTLQITGIGYVVPTPSSTPVTMTLSGLRAAVATVKNGLSGSQVVATVAAPGFSVLTPPIVMAVGSSALKSGVVNNGIPCNGSPLPDTLDFQGFVDAGTSSSAIRVTEGIPGALAPKSSSTTIGTRIIVRLTGYGSGVRLFVPDALVGNSGNVSTSGGQFASGVQSGTYTPSSNQLLLSRVSGADQNGLGGTLVTTLPAAQTTFTGVSELTLDGGSAYAVYEVLDGNPLVTESVQVPVFIANIPSACSSTFQTNLSVVEGPISTAVTATATDSVPRYIDLALGSDCQQDGDCSANYYPVLSISSDPVNISGSSLGPVETVSVPMSNGGGSQLNLGITISYDSGSGWLAATPQASNGALSLSLAADPASLEPGTYKATVNIDAGTAGSAAVPVLFTVGQKGIAIQAIVNAASYQSGALAPGAYVALFGHDLLGVNGSGLTPVVTFDGLTAGVVYSSAGQINLIVPPALAAQSTSNVQVKVGAEVSNAFKVTLTPNMPGIFTPGLVNSDGSVNSATNVATRGDFVEVYLTGLAFPAIPGGITISMGGQAGIVPLFAGPQPTYPALDQINVTIPASLALAGDEVPIAVCVATLPGTQPTCSNSVTLYIK